MPDPFARLIPEARAFLGELVANNSRDWFTGQKARFEAELKTPATGLLDRLTHDAEQQLGVLLKPKLFRQNRDVRFAKDKSPYHPHLHMLWSVLGPGRQAPALFFGISPDYVTVGGGVMGFDKSALAEWRLAVDGAFGDEMETALADLAAKGLEPHPPQLKRVPAPYPQDHRHAELLRRKGLTVWRELRQSEYSKPLAVLLDTLADLRAMFDHLEDLY